MAILLVVVCLVGCSGAGIGSSSLTVRAVSPTAPPAPSQPPLSPSSTTSASGVQTGDLAAVQSGFAGPEAFCGTHGRITYSSRNGEGRLDVALRGLPRSAMLGLDWLNSDIRGYAVGYVTTTAAGTIDPADVVFYRAPGTHGIGMLLTTIVDDDTTVASFTPC